MDIKYESAYARKIKAKERNGTAILNRIAVELLSFAVGASLNLAQMPFAANTLGIAALCASAEQTVAMFLGLLITSALVPYFNSKIIILIYAVAFAVRLLIGLFRGWSEKTGREIISGIFKESLSARAILCGFACFGVGLYRLMLSGFLYYDLFGTVTGIVVGVVATVLWYPLRDKRQWGCFSAWRAAGALCLCFACIWGLRDIRLYGVSLSVFAAMLTTLFITRRKGLLWEHLMLFLQVLLFLFHMRLCLFSLLYATPCCFLFRRFCQAWRRLYPEWRGEYILAEYRLLPCSCPLC